MSNSPHYVIFVSYVCTLMTSTGVCFYLLILLLDNYSGDIMQDTGAYNLHAQSISLVIGTYLPAHPPPQPSLIPSSPHPLILTPSSLSNLSVLRTQHCLPCRLLKAFPTAITEEPER